MEAGGAELGRLHPATRLCHLLEQAHAAPGIEQVCGRDEGVVAGAHEDNIGLPRRIVHVHDPAHLTLGQPAARTSSS